MLMNNIPAIPSDEQDAWKVAEVYFEYYQSLANLGFGGWAALGELEKAIAVSKFENLQTICRGSGKPWTNLLLRTLDSIVNLHEKFQSTILAKNPRKLSRPSNLADSFPMQQSPMLPSYQTSTTDFPSSLGEVSSPYNGNMHGPNLFRDQDYELSLGFDSPYAENASRPFKPDRMPDAFFGETEDEKFARYQTLMAIHHREHSGNSTIPPQAGEEHSLVHEETRSEIQLSAGLIEDESYDLNDLDRDENVLNDRDFATEELCAQSILTEKLGPLRESNPADYFGDLQPQSSSTSPFQRFLPQMNLPPRLRQVIDTIRSLELTATEQKHVKDTMAHASGWKVRKDAAPIQLARQYLEKLEIRRALFSSAWWKIEMRKDYELMLNTWGVTAEHDETCVMVNHIFQKWLPKDLVREFIRDQTFFKTHYLPVLLFKGRSGRNSKEHRAASIASFGTGARFTLPLSGASMVLTRFLSWCHWSERQSVPQSQKHDELMFNAKSSLHGSHRCGHGHCLIHCIFESRAMNKQRDLCQHVARQLRKDGKPVPRYCELHKEHPCLMRLQALTTAETFNIQISIALGEARHWVDETDELPDIFPTRENSYPFQFIHGFPPVDPALTQTSAQDYHDMNNPSKLKLYEGCVPSLLSERVHCSLCLMSFTSYQLKFYNHCIDEHAGHPQFLDALRAHRRQWSEQLKSKPGQGGPPLKALDKLLENGLQLTNDAAIELIKDALRICPFCPTLFSKSDIEPATWRHLNTHYEEEKYLDVVLRKSEIWLPRNVRAFGMTKERARDLINQFLDRPDMAREKVLKDKSVRSVDAAQKTLAGDMLPCANEHMKLKPISEFSRKGNGEWLKDCDACRQRRKEKYEKNKLEWEDIVQSLEGDMLPCSGEQMKLKHKSEFSRKSNGEWLTECDTCRGKSEEWTSNKLKATWLAENGQTDEGDDEMLPCSHEERKLKPKSQFSRKSNGEWLKDCDKCRARHKASYERRKLALPLQDEQAEEIEGEEEDDANDDEMLPCSRERMKLKPKSEFSRKSNGEWLKSCNSCLVTIKRARHQRLKNARPGKEEEEDFGLRRGLEEDLEEQVTRDKSDGHKDGFELDERDEDERDEDELD
jgi:hypothetical protein